MTVSELIQRLQELPQRLEVVLPEPEPRAERATHLPCAAASVKAARGHGGVGRWDLDGANGRTLVWQAGVSRGACGGLVWYRLW